MSPSAKHTHPLTRDGRSQEDRVLPALAPDYAKVDGKSLEEVLEFVYAYASRVNYYDEEMTKSDWLDFFKNSVPFQQARIIHYDLAGLDRDYQSLQADVQRDLEMNALTQLLDFLLDIVHLLETWKLRLRDDTSGLVDFIDNLITSNLGRLYGRLFSYTQGGHQWEYQAKIDVHNLSSAWNGDILALTSVNTNLHNRSLSQQRRTRLAIQDLEEIYRGFREALGYIIDEAKLTIKKSTEHAGANPSHIGLFFAFLDVYQHARNDLNRMTGRHMDFFYRSILRLREKEAVPDEAHLIFELSPQLVNERIPALTTFLGGEDNNGEEVHFRLEKEIIIDHAQVASLRTLFLDQVVERLDDNGLPQYAVKGVHVAPIANSADGKGEAFADDSPTKSWETLGEKTSKFAIVDADGINQKFTDHPYPTLGLLLASDELLLKEGQRTITLTFVCHKDSLDILEPDLAALESAVLTQFAVTDFTELALSENGIDLIIPDSIRNKWKNGQEAFKQFLLQQTTGNANPAFNLTSVDREKLLKYAERSSVFDISLTIEGEWLPVQEANIWLDPLPDADNPNLFYLKAELLLDDAQPAILGFDPEAHGLAIDLDQPTARLTFNHAFKPTVSIGSAGVSLYHYFRHLTVSDVLIEIDVNNVRNLVLQSDGALLDPNSPFFPFGPIPKEGAQFYIGSQEIFQKDLENLVIHLQWDGLPESFPIHYKAYATPENLPKNSDFKATVDLLKGREWIAQNGEIPLFAEEISNPGALIPKTVLIDERKIPLSFNPQEKNNRIAEELSRFDVNTQNGFLRFTLGEQDFLHDEFSRAMARQMLAIAKTENATDVIDGAIYEVQSELIELLKEQFALAAQELVTYESLLNSLRFSFNVLDQTVSPGADQATLDAISATDVAIKAVNNEFNASNWSSAMASLTPLLQPDVINVDTALRDQAEAAKDAVDALLISTDLTGLRTQLDALVLLASSFQTLNGPVNNLTATLSAAQASLTAFFNNIDQFTLNAAPGNIPIPNEPYTPTIKSISIDYTSSTNKRKNLFIHLYPFEGSYLRESLPNNSTDPAPTLLPKFVDQGTLFLGIDRLRPGGSLHLLFQMAESTADPFMQPADVSWHYLADNKWTALRPAFDLIDDATDGLLQSGIVQLAIPREITSDNTLLSPGLFWLKATVKDRAEAISETIAVHAQAGKVVFINNGNNDLSRLSEPWVKEQISEPVDTLSFLQSVQQPYDSFGGRPPESAGSFNTRISERLRHKGRAITLFDYERLVLEAYPQIYKVKCITHTLGFRGPADRDDHLAPGYITIAVIPDLRQLQFADRFQPKATLALLGRIEAYLLQRTSPFVRLRVLNPTYEPINFKANVAFKLGLDTTFYKAELVKDVQQFLAPWAHDVDSQISFGGRIFRSSVLNFVEERSYIDYVTDFTMFGADRIDVAEAAAGSARSILVPGKLEFTDVTQCASLTENKICEAPSSTVPIAKVMSSGTNRS